MFVTVLNGLNGTKIWSFRRAGGQIYRTSGAVIGIRFVIVGAVADQPDDSRFRPIGEMGGSPEGFADRRPHQFENRPGLHRRQETLNRNRPDNMRLDPYSLDSRGV